MHAALKTLQWLTAFWGSHSEIKLSLRPDLGSVVWTMGTKSSEQFTSFLRQTKTIRKGELMPTFREVENGFAKFTALFLIEKLNAFRRTANNRVVLFLQFLSICALSSQNSKSLQTKWSRFELIFATFSDKSLVWGHVLEVGNFATFSRHWFRSSAVFSHQNVTHDTPASHSVPIMVKNCYTVKAVKAVKLDRNSLNSWTF